MKLSKSDITPEIEARFWSRVDRSGGPDACWLWQRVFDDHGYGFFSSNAKTERSRRVAYEIAVGVIPDGLCVLHRCDNPPCCNPSHLFIGTIADNNADRDRKGRQRSMRGDGNGARLHPEKMPRGDDHHARKHPEKLSRGDRHYSRRHPEKLARGEGNGHSKLTATAVISIRGLIGTGITQRSIAKLFGVSESEISAIKHVRLWRHLSSS